MVMIISCLNTTPTFECVDVAPETIAGRRFDQDGAVFYHVEPRCGSLPCPPYEPQKEMTCCLQQVKSMAQY